MSEQYRYIVGYRNRRKGSLRESEKFVREIELPTPHADKLKIEDVVTAIVQQRTMWAYETVEVQWIFNGECDLYTGPRYYTPYEHEELVTTVTKEVRFR